MLVFNSFLKTYGPVTILDIPAFSLPDGIYWLKAENGKGKSTLLKTISGILPFKGSICLEEKDLQRNRIFQRQAINYAEAEAIFPSFLKGKDLIDFFVKTKKGDALQACLLAKKLKIDNALSLEIGTYSSGMLKKLSLILAFIGRPKWILLDEPLITLDIVSTRIILETIKSLYETGISFIITSHQSFIVSIPDIQILTIDHKTLSLDTSHN